MGESLEYKRSKHGLIKKRYQGMKQRVRGDSNRPHLYLGLELMGAMEFYYFAMKSAEFSKIYIEWVESGHKPALVPSVDRIDSSKGYTKDNIRFVTKKQNEADGLKSRWARGDS